MAKPYRGDLMPPDNARPRRVLGLMILLCGAIYGGILLGGIYFLSAQLVYLIAISPLFAGVVAGLLYTAVIHYSKTRQRMTVIFFALVLVAAMFITFWYANYQQFKRESRQEILNSDLTVTLSNQTLDLMIDDFLQDEVNQRGFLGYLIWNTREGMTVSSQSYSTPTDTSSRWSGTVTTGYRLLEIVGVLVMVTVAGVSASQMPFSEETQRWLEYKPVGMVQHNQVNEFLNAIQQQNFQHARTLIQAKTPKPRLEVDVARFHALAPNAWLRIKANGKQRQELLNTPIPTQVYEIMSGT